MWSRSAPQTWILEEGLGSCVKDELSKPTEPKSEAVTLMSLSSKLRGHCDLPPRVSTLAVDSEVVRVRSSSRVGFSQGGDQRPN